MVFRQKSPDFTKSRPTPEVLAPNHRPPTHHYTPNTPLFPRNPLFPPSDPAPRLPQGPPAKSKFLAARKGYSDEQVRDHGEKEAERIIAAAAKLFGRDGSDWTTLPKGDWRKGLVAGLIRERSLVPNGWVARRLTMGATGAVSRAIREARERAKSERKVGRAARELLRNVQSF